MFLSVISPKIKLNVRFRNKREIKTYERTWYVIIINKVLKAAKKLSIGGIHK